jgi:hypothetical protein
VGPADVLVQVREQRRARHHRQRGLDTAFYELNSALHEALEDPQACLDRYAQGQPAFTRATVTVSHGSLI